LGTTISGTFPVLHGVEILGYKMSDVNLEQNCFVHPKKILKIKNFDMQLP
jgi:hypothetical protein